MTPHATTTVNRMITSLAGDVRALDQHTARHAARYLADNADLSLAHALVLGTARTVNAAYLFTTEPALTHIDPRSRPRLTRREPPTMNTVIPLYPAPPNPQTWNRPHKAAAIHVRDWTRIYRQLRKVGYSQQRIARHTGQSQPEVSAITHGPKVMAYDVQERIATRLGIPLCRIGLNPCCACCGHTTPTDHEIGRLLLPSGPLVTPNAPQPALLPPE
jgi:hypothetical protein